VPTDEVVGDESAVEGVEASGDGAGAAGQRCAGVDGAGGAAARAWSARVPRGWCVPGCPGRGRAGGAGGAAGDSGTCGYGGRAGCAGSGLGRRRRHGDACGRVVRVPCPALAVRWYLRYGLSYRDLEELLAERGIEVDHVTLYRWVQRFTPLMIDVARPVRHLAGDRWFVDETYVKVSGVWSYVYRAVDQHGQVIDVYVSQRRDIAAARTFFTAAVAVHGDPAEVITDRAPALAT